MEDGVADHRDRLVELVDGGPGPFPESLGIVECRLQSHPGGKQSLDDQIVEIARDPVAVFDHGEPLSHQALFPGGTHLFGDVANDSHHVALAIDGHGTQGDLDRHERTVGPQSRHLRVRVGHLANTRGVVIGTTLFAMTGAAGCGNEIVDGASEQFPTFVAEQLEGLLVGDSDAAIGVDDDDRIGCRVQELLRERHGAGLGDRFGFAAWKKTDPEL